jgi:hypothetical protein
VSLQRGHGTRGSQRLYTDGRFQFASGKAKLTFVPFIDNNERHDEEYPGQQSDNTTLQRTGIYSSVTSVFLVSLLC